MDWKIAPLLTILLTFGYVKKIPCEGRLYISVIGNSKLVQLEALPKELGCGVVLKPLATSGRTNLILETSTGTIEEEIIIRGGAL